MKKLPVRLALVVIGTILLGLGLKHLAQSTNGGQVIILTGRSSADHAQHEEFFHGMLTWETFLTVNGGNYSDSHHTLITLNIDYIEGFMEGYIEVRV